MRRKNNKKCLCCSETYTFCLHCSDFDSLPRWMNLFHNENCKNLFEITNAYLSKEITADEAKERYEKCDLSYKDKLKKSIVDAIDEVSKSLKKEVNKKKVAEEVSESAIETVK